MSSRELLDELFGIFIATTDQIRVCDRCAPGMGHNDQQGSADVLVEASFLPERSAFNTALRGGDWSPGEYREARIINELAAAHAAGRGYDPLLSPGEIAAEKAHDTWQIRRHAENLAELRGER